MNHFDLSEFQLCRFAAGVSKKEAAELLEVSTATITNWENGVSQPKKPFLEALKKQNATLGRRKRTEFSPAFTFIDLFAGIGGMRCGFEMAGGKCVFTSEWNRYSLETYLRNFGYSHPVIGDITKADAGSIPSHDVLVAGFPCQPFSIAGVSKKRAIGQPDGFECKTQGTLFFEVARIIAHHRPKAFLLENVKNLISHDRGRTFQVILDTLNSELGYQVYWKVIDAKPWLPQHRERIFIVGFSEPTSFSFDLLEVPRAEEHPTLDSVLHREDGSEPPEPHYTIGNIGRVSEKYVLSDHLWKYLRDYAEKHRAKGNGFGFGLVGRHDVSRTLSARYYKDGAEILVRRNEGPPRRLTPRECCRLMGFDAPGRPNFLIPVSDTQAYKQFGNSVAVPVVSAVAGLMSKFLKQEQEEGLQATA